MIDLIEIFLADSFADDPRSMIEKLKHDRDIFAIVIGHFIQDASPEFFSVLLFKIPPDNLKTIAPTTVVYRATSRQYCGHQLAVHQLVCLQCFLKEHNICKSLFS